VQKTAPLNFCTPPDQPVTVSGQWQIGIIHSLSKNQQIIVSAVIPEKVRIQWFQIILDTRFRQYDGSA